MPLVEVSANSILAPSRSPRPLIGALSLLQFCLACAPESKELLAVKSARSIVSEWELVNREAAAGRLTRVYVDGMRGEATSQLRSQARASSSMVTPAALEIAKYRAVPATRAQRFFIMPF
jgi:hypothetical protein